MTRTDDDTWDLASSVGATATMVAAARAAASRHPDRVINDPFAEPLVRAVGLDLFTRLAAGELDAVDRDGKLGFPRMIDTFAARAVFFDQYFADAGNAGLKQVVILASGLDSRPYRLSWPAGTTVYELDQPEVLEFKAATVSKLGAVSNAEHRSLPIDLRDDWPAALRKAGFDPGEPTAWLAEGLLIGWLPPEAEVQMLDNIVSLSAPASRLGADYGQVAGLTEETQKQAQVMGERWRDLGLELDVATLTYPGEHIDVAAHLRSRGWHTTTSDLAELFDAAKLPPLGDAAQHIPGNSIFFVRASAP
ncbi:SAM-dependent methyltransferase [Mycobacterium bourgelatii]|uniref:S-adenosyl-L-methionine-dependent methyltransferase n=1 Tax=Mycobacterium bourgelatii TaxID=1273442 RepID=A0A7I9YVB7_MYCBU|nr:SAM-dependent methyltransferase [Mycobacterium bourgelatii]MCV6976252.1 SAM-dependent methyltransferase [Mycobacterium bourgelatii]GFG92641.1 putative S-adenosyl-L-methionine-dependent methyltransferase [Mycobacterium bourgelatii]